MFTSKLKNGALKMKKGKSNTKTIIKYSLIALCFVALLITDAFIPVKYLASYFGFAMDEVEYCGENKSCVHFIDVGYGDATFINFADGKCALIDGGDGTYSNQLEITSLINAHGKSKLNYLICTSVNEKRCGGLAELVQIYDVEKIFYPYCYTFKASQKFHDFKKVAKKRGATIDFLETGKGFKGENYFLEILSPTDHKSPMSEYNQLNSNFSNESINLASGIIYLNIDGVKMLFCGDADAYRLNRLCDEYVLGAFSGDGHFGEIILENCDVIKLARGGEEKAFSTALVDFIKPKTAIISYGYKNYNYISAHTLSALETLDGAYITNGATINLIIENGDYAVFQKE